jgi:hypothetical protein
MLQIDNFILSNTLKHPGAVLYLILSNLYCFIYETRGLITFSKKKIVHVANKTTSLSLFSFFGSELNKVGRILEGGSNQARD